MDLEKKFFNNFYKKNPLAFEQNKQLQKLTRLYFLQMLEELSGRIPLEKSQVLSIGCGTGRFELMLAPYIKKIIGLDVSEVGITLARKKNEFSNVEFLVASATNLPFEDEEFEIILSLSAIHHIKDKPKLFGEFSRVLKGGGVIYAVEPNSKGFLHQLGEKFFKKIYHKIHSPEESSVDPFQMEIELNKYGFKNSKIQYRDFFFGPLAYLNPKVPAIFFDACYLVNKILINIPLVKNYSCEFNLLAVKELSRNM